MTNRQLTCISCPIGCEISVQLNGNEVVSIEGNRCPRGEVYARQEAIEPLRVLPTSVKVINGDRPLVSVRTDGPIPRRLVTNVMDYIRGLEVNAPIEIGQIIEDNLLATGTALIATRTVKSNGQEQGIVDT